MKNLKPYRVINHHLLSALPGSPRKIFQRARVEPLRLISIIALLSVIVIWAFGSGMVSAAGTVELVSVNSTGNGSGNEQSVVRAISADGRYVLFESSASDLVIN